MTFDEWWTDRFGESSRPDSTYTENDLRQWACLSWIAGFQVAIKLNEDIVKVSEKFKAQTPAPVAPDDTVNNKWTRNGYM